MKQKQHHGNGVKERGKPSIVINNSLKEIFYYLDNYYLDLYYENNIVYVYSVR